MPRSRSRLVVAALVIAMLPSVAHAADTVESAINPIKSKASFSVQHVFVEHVTGTLPIVGGTVVRAPGSIVPESATAVLDAGKVTTGERDRDMSLQSPDFFDVKKYPTWSFTSTKIVPHGATAFGMDGVLTLHGVAVPEHLDVVAHGDAQHPTYHAVARIDRHAFGMARTRLDPVIGTTVDVTLDIELR